MAPHMADGFSIQQDGEALSLRQYGADTLMG